MDPWLDAVAEPLRVDSGLEDKRVAVHESLEAGGPAVSVDVDHVLVPAGLFDRHVSPPVVVAPKLLAGYLVALHRTARE